MIINHNLTALNTYNHLTSNEGAAQKSIAKLSSGYRINSAADDAAGLAISEKMRGQIRGLDQAGRNSQDGISLVQTAEGALGETTDILQRMRELAVQSSSDTNTSDDRKKLQGETDQLAKEITRISNTTQFNTQNLLAGGFHDTFQIGANTGQDITLSINAMDASSLGVAGNMVSSAFSGGNTTGLNVTSASADMAGYHVATGSGVAATISSGVAKSNGQGASGTTGSIDGSGYTGSVDKTFVVKVTAVSGASGGGTTGAEAVKAAKYSVDGGTTWTQAAVSGTSVKLSDNVKIDIGNSSSGTAVGDTYTFTATAAYKTAQLSNSSGTTVGNQVKIYSNMSNVTIGDASQDKQVTLDFNYKNVASGTASGTIAQVTTKSTAASIGSDGQITAQAVTQKGIDISTQAAASKAITVLDNAIKSVSEERSKFGAVQNRLEHTINNLSTSSENLTAAESRIRDVDMAKEMMTYTKNNVLTQAAQSMLSQANQQPQSVLQLLR